MEIERIFALAGLAFAALMFTALWKIYSKAGQAGWKSLVPIYGAVVFLRIVGRPWWWLFLIAIPVVNFLPLIALCIDLARAFGKGGAYAAGLMMLTPVFLLMLAFGDARYQTRHHAKATPEPARTYGSYAA